jgi:CarD family transcriptional regulator
MYHGGEYVVYGVHGVCRVIGTEKQLVNRKRTEYLVLEPLVQQESRFYLPTQNPAAMAKLKTVLSRDELHQLMDSDEIRKDCWIQEENLRKQRYRDLIGSGERTALMRMVSSLYRYKDEQTAAGRKFHQCDDNFLRDAEKLLCSEISLVLELEPEQAREYLRNHLR